MSLKKNIIANYLGVGWSALMSIAFVPLYLHFMGADGYGLVGFFVMLSATLSILDAGLASVAIREAAGFTGGDAQRRQEVVALLRSIEIVFLAIACLAGCGVALLAPWLVQHWLNVPVNLVADATWAIVWMGMSIALQFFISFYSGCLTGFQRQIELNTINIIGATVRSGGAVLVLWLISPSMQAFFAWQAIGAFSILLVQRILYLRSMEGVNSGLRFSLNSLKRVRHFLVGMGSINILALLLTQLDKIILSSVLSLKAFGFYSIAWMLGTLIYRLTGPVFNSYYPKITQLLEQKQQCTMMDVYTQGCRVMAVAVVPISLWMALFSYEIMELWTHNAELANQASGALSVFAIGTMFNAFMHIPYAIQLAHSYTRLALVQNIIAVILLAPLTWYFATNYGLTATALPWLMVNAGYVILGAPLMYHFLKLSGLRNWYVQSIFIPVLYAGGSIMAIKMIWKSLLGEKAIIFLLPIALAVGVLMGLWGSQLITLGKLRRWKYGN